MTNYTLTNASNACRWIAGELMVGENYADGVTPEHLEWIIKQCPHGDLTVDERTHIEQVVADGPMRCSTAGWHNMRTQRQADGALSELAAWET